MAAPPMYTANPTQVIALNLPINQAPNDSVPYELQKYYSKDIWAARQRAVLMKGSRYLKPRFEIIFAVFMFLSMLAVPIVIYYVALHTLPAHLTQVGETFNGERIFNDDRVWEARAASVGALVGLILLGWVPLFIWKARGKRQVNQMLRKFSVEDAAVAGPSAQVPQWSMKMPGIGSKAIHLMISYPRPPMSSPFQLGLPPYLVNPPMDPAAAGYYMQASHAPGQPHHAPGNAMSGIPLYNENEEKIPDYSGPTNDTYLPHEKERFEDIKV
ncbi:hypothetical protein DICSQDRAFT_124598 [Dichomitus squalens LYAD-421 SS1]|uniref:uncharacterized protein n=1 Tax=Dichomitus squalens (strain LYAD-421) TaxID=732165 RepID=UPI000441534D|nr:uncharacterized protein DICSQDRAFT_124598 [Dichomitus squalens LYAD-421 SS1]EJF65411.1 hypothetical protein DICSQDRAFT_124598 [Dichomitus squalens LYAD-421 SS1]